MVSGTAIDFPAAASNRGEMPSGPVALFVFKAIILFATSPYDTRASYIYGAGLRFIVVIVRYCGLLLSASFIPTVAKKQFSKSAFSLSSTARDSSSRFSGPISFWALGLVALDRRFQ